MWIDVFQIMMMLIGLLASLIKGVINSGGVENVLETCWKGKRLELLEYCDLNVDFECCFNNLFLNKVSI